MSPPLPLLKEGSCRKFKMLPLMAVLILQAKEGSCRKFKMLPLMAVLILQAYDFVVCASGRHKCENILSLYGPASAHSA